ncbi:Flagellar biosynthesis protein FlhB [hydrothermal vent metagenome]|uniref:Flagellar biosynthetic protein FlhB n=1 Tax=hydrothermal vent metagenome TaxID=652676 RepID=A0A3B0W8B3_9ZZZZ
MSQDTGQERTEQATPKKLKESREKGQVPRSKELNSMTLLMASGGGFLLMGESMLIGFSETLTKGLSFKNAQEIDADGIVRIFGETALDCLLLVAPLFALLVVVTMLTPLGLGGWSFSLKAISFKLEKLDPIKGIGRIFALKGLVELVKVLAKFLLVASVSGFIIWSLIEELVGLGEEPIQAALAHVASLCGWSFMASSSVLIIIAALDAPFQLWQHNKQLKMTKQEVKDENKETDGRPEVKGRIRALQQELSQRRMMDAVPDADVIITNPTHYSVALKYDQFGMKAPIVVAKGADLIAYKIRTVAEKNNVTVVSAPPLARALFASTELDQEIPGGLYVAVATILSYVYQLKASVYNGDTPPDSPSDLPIPEEFKDVLNPDNDDNIH